MGRPDSVSTATFLSIVAILERGKKIVWDSKRQKNFIEMVREICSPQDVNDNNAATARAAGTSLAIQLFPQLDSHSSWTTYVEDVWDAWYRKRDTGENGLTYNSIWAMFMLHLSDLLDRSSLLRDSSVHTIFARFEAQATPSGIMPPYGDDGVGNSPSEQLQCWTSVFERMAKETQDASFRWTAQRLFKQEYEG